MRYIKGWIHAETQRSRCLDCGRPLGRNGKPSGYWNAVVVGFQAAADDCDKCGGPMFGETLDAYNDRRTAHA